jgi:membrane-associated phospholipid phosphatase
MGILKGIDWLLRLDVKIELFLNHFVGLYPWFDTTITTLNAFTLVNSAVIVLFLWLVLFDRNRSGQLREGFDLLIGSAFFSLVATLAARALTFLLPFRDCPSADPSIIFNVPGHIHLSVMTWSSIPSDQATLFFALASGIFMVSRRVGCLAIAWVSLTICVPLLYMGINWPTDILSGALLGISVSQLSRVPLIRGLVRRFSVRWHRVHPRVFYAVFFVWTFEAASTFGNVRHILKFIVDSI